MDSGAQLTKQISEKGDRFDLTERETINSSSTFQVYEPYRLSVDRVAKLLETDTQTGLSTTEANHRRQQYGPNALGEGSKISVTSILAHQLFNAMILVLLISMVIALAIKDWISGGVIAFVVFINISIGFFQEYQAEKTMSSLRSLSSSSARVTRDGTEQVIDAEDLVPGDLVHIKVGDTVPADLRLMTTSNLETEEAMLTGESLPIPKDTEAIFEEDSMKPVSVGDRSNMAFSSSVVAKGRGVGIVFAVGLNTEIGEIAKSLQEGSTVIVKPDKEDGAKGVFKAIGKTTWNILGNILGIKVGTPLQRKLSWLAIVLFGIAVVFAIVVMGSQKMRVNTSVAIYAICVALSMIPSSLIVVLTITMAVGAKVMMHKHVIVRKLDALEALGGVDNICSDKTGTLTQGKMIGKKVWIPTVGTYCVSNSGEPFNPNVGDLTFTEYSPKDLKEADEETNFLPKVPDPIPKDFADWLNTATLANIANVYEEKDESGENIWNANGDPTEIAIQVFTMRLNNGRKQIEGGYEHLQEFPFDSTIKRMSVIYKNKESGQYQVYTKGAVERILDRCTHWIIQENEDDKLVELSDEDRDTIGANMDCLSAEGLRVLAFATKSIDKSFNMSDRKEVESGLVFQGLIGIYDPPRNESASSVKLCHKAGINVHMLTGDHPGTARAIAQEVGILPIHLGNYSEDVVKCLVMTASEFDILSDEEIDEMPVLPLVVARCSPQTKVKMIDALHRRQKFAAMTGDGVNDSPSLKRADVGIAMGQNGSDVAKDISDIILTDDNFASILNAIEEGRRMSDNIQKFVLQLLAANIAQALYLLIGLAFIDESGYSVFPLSPVEVLWIIVVTSCFPAMGLGQERASEDILDKPPNKSIFTRQLIVDMLAYGLIMAVCCLVCFVIIVYGVGNGDLGVNCNDMSATLEKCDLVFRARSGSFVSMTWCALILAWECIHPTNSLFYMRQNTNNSWWRQTAIDLWSNKFLFWSIVGGIISVFPIVYIPVINTKVFLHTGIGYEWGLSVAFSLTFLGGAECYKWFKRAFLRRRKAKNPEYELTRKDPLKSAASFSRAGTTENKAFIV